MRYFAYGSNLNAEDLRAWCATHGVAYPLGPKIANAWLPDHEVAFDVWPGGGGAAVLSLRLRTGQATPGVLFEVDEEGFATLDRRRGAPEACRRQRLTVLLEDGGTLDAEAYVGVCGRRPGGRVLPTAEYVRIVAAGLAAHGLPTAMHEAAAGGEPPAPLLPHLFTYGTLRRGGRRHNLVEGNLVRHAPAAARGHLHDLGGYPGMTTDRRGGIVRGDLCTLRDPSAALALLDRIESFAGFGAEGSLFRRALVRAVTREGLEVTAWAYLWARAPQGEPVASGDWHRR
jgi:gamma-glutamylcyclotransferase (GGCT)/AIG2-like uncharacterized protein YtfP